MLYLHKTTVGFSRSMSILPLDKTFFHFVYFCLSVFFVCLLVCVSVVDVVFCCVLHFVCLFSFCFLFLFVVFCFVFSL